MHLVDEVNLVGIGTARGGEVRLLTEVADFIDAAVTGGVQFDEVQCGALEVGPAGLARVAGLAGVRLAAVYGLREQPAHRRLACAARPREEVGVGHLAAGDGVGQGARNHVLAGKLSEGAWAVLPIKDCCGHIDRPEYGCIVTGWAQYNSDAAPVSMAGQVGKASS